MPSLDGVGVKDADDVRVADAGEENGLPEHLRHLVGIDARLLEHLHRLASEELVVHAIHFGERSLSEETFDLIGVANLCAFFKE